jgi:uncharacterized surface protein with fasciclin (FAS1) repeats
MSTILQILNADQNLRSWVRGMKAANMEEVLSGFGPFTILAPVNLAFGNIASYTFEELLKPANNGKLLEMLSGHVLLEKRLLKDFTNGQKIKNLLGKEVNVTVKDNEVRINGAKILAKDRQGSNGVVHSVDAVNVIA